MKPRARQPVRVAYIVLAHKLPAQLVRLVRLLADGRTDVLVHVDRTTDAGVFREMRAGAGGLDGVVWLPRHPCEWGGFGYMRGALEGVTLLVRSGAGYDYAILLSGQDYPIKPSEHIRAFLTEHRGTSFLEHYALPRSDWPGRGGLERFETRRLRLGRWGWNVRDRGLGRLLPARTLRPGDLRLYQGGTWWILERECIEYMHEFVNAHPDVVGDFARVRNPAESFFQTILMGSPLRERITNDDVRYERWHEGGDHPDILTVADLERLRASRGLFARKFDITVDGEILDRIDEELLGR